MLLHPVIYSAVPRPFRLLIYFLLYCIQTIKEMPAALITAQQAFLFSGFSFHVIPVTDSCCHGEESHKLFYDLIHLDK